jgi:tetratricopeptide (TPR) repeat protein
LLQKALAASRKKLGPDHASSIKILNSLGLTHMSDGNFGQAVPWLEEAVQRQTKRYGDDHFDSLTILNNLGAAYRNSGRPAEAIPLFERAVKVARKRKGAADPDTVGAMQDLAIVNLEANRAAGAEKICRELREILQPDSRGLAETLSDLGESLLRQEKFADAESVLIESVGIFEKKQPNLSPLFTAQSRLGWALLGQGKNAPAKDLLLNAHKGLARRQIERPSSARASLLTDIANRLVQLYEAEKDPDEAAKWRQKSQSP